MSSAEVTDALQVSGPQERAGGPYRWEDFADGVAAFYDAGKLACVALDAVTGAAIRGRGSVSMTRPAAAPLPGADRPLMPVPPTVGTVRSAAALTLTACSGARTVAGVQQHGVALPIDASTAARGFVLRRENA